MPLETRDQDPAWATGYRTSPEEAQRNRQTWLDAGRQAWNDATRTGRNVVARTESELAALGRAQLEAEALRERQANAATYAVANAGLQGSLAISEPMLGLGTQSDPGPGRLVREWRTGTGPEQRDLPADSRFARDFAKAPSVEDHLRRASAAWQGRTGGLDAQGGTYTDYRGLYEPGQFFGDLVSRRTDDPLPRPNWAAEVIGSSKIDGRRAGDHLEWTARNAMGRHSFFYGRPLESAGLPAVADRPRPAPYGTTRQTIHLRTDLQGKPINKPIK